MRPPLGILQDEQLKIHFTGKLNLLKSLSVSCQTCQQGTGCGQNGVKDVKKLNRRWTIYRCIASDRQMGGELSSI